MRKIFVWRAAAKHIIESAIPSPLHCFFLLTEAKLRCASHNVHWDLWWQGNSLTSIWSGQMWRTHQSFPCLISVGVSSWILQKAGVWWNIHVQASFYSISDIFFSPLNEFLPRIMAWMSVLKKFLMLQLLDKIMNFWEDAEFQSKLNCWEYQLHIWISYVLMSSSELNIRTLQYQTWTLTWTVFYSLSKR